MNPFDMLLNPFDTLQYPLTNSCDKQLLMDTTGFKTVEELLELAEDTHGWAAEVRKLDPDLTDDQRNTRSRDANFTLDVSAPEWKKGADIHDGAFRG